MTEFTRILVDPHDARARRALISLERLHAIIARSTDPDGSLLTADADTPNNARTLWRLDDSRRGLRSSLYIVSESVPSREVLIDQLGIDPEDGFATSPYDPFLERLETGQEWGFRLKVNATKSVPSGKKAVRGKRIPVVKQEEQIEWLERKAMQNGFHLPINRVETPEVVIGDSGVVNFERKNATVTLSMTVFDGVLAIDDPQKMRHALMSGIGRAKGYGCGLLTLVPLSRSGMTEK